MIHLEVEKSSDSLALGLYEYEFDIIRIGRSKKNDLIFLDPELPLHYLVIMIVQDQLIVQSLQKEPYYFVNGKKVSGTLKLKNNDTIAFGPNKIRVIDSRKTGEELDLALAYENFNSRSPELKYTLDFIEEVLMDLEKDAHVS